MIDWIRKDVDEELIRNVMAVLGQKKEVEIRFWIDKESPLDDEGSYIWYQAFGKIRLMKTSGLDFFERNDTTITSRVKYSGGAVILPALEMVFEDPDNPGYHMVGFIEGRNNVTKFIQRLAKDYLEKYPPEKVMERYREEKVKREA